MTILRGLSFDDLSAPEVLRRYPAPRPLRPPPAADPAAASPAPARPLPVASLLPPTRRRSRDLASFLSDDAAAPTVEVCRPPAPASHSSPPLRPRRSRDLGVVDEDPSKATPTALF